MSDVFPPPAPSTRGIDPGTWSIHWDQYSLYEQEVTGGHLAFLVLLHGEDSWANLDISELAMADPAIGPGRLMSWIIAMVAFDEAYEDEEQMAAMVQTVRDAPAEKILSSLRRH